ncbi:MAG: ABC transporter substrate-binding protein [Clostridiales bacterium]|nr:ABC transporter substrate-binding protein [Clostridiales bacterium]
MRYIALILACLLMAPAALAGSITFTDAMGVEVTLEKTPERVAALLGSYGDIWLQAGGTLAGATEDAIIETGLDLEGDITVIGSDKTPNLELLLALDPDFAILSADTARHVAARPALEAAGIPCGYFSVLTWQDYMEVLDIFTAVTGRRDLYEAQQISVAEAVEQVVSAARSHPEYGKHTVLLLRAYVTSVRAKDSRSTVAGPILKDMGLVNIADGSGLMENLSMESIIAMDPDYIFVVFMGLDKEGARRKLSEQLLSDPAWNTLSAVKNGRYIVLDHKLFHYRPNARWAEAYRMIGEIVYGS